MRVYNEYSGKLEQLSYWRLASGIEIDFIIGDMLCAIGAKSSKNIGVNEMKHLRTLIQDHPELKTRIIVTISGAQRVTEDGIQILSAKDFVRLLWDGEIF